ncbi:MAG TPA: DUF799 family lipoprotein [bacterium]|nr:DUF799 family lipoprotein [bacterium]
MHRQPVAKSAVCLLFFGLLSAVLHGCAAKPQVSVDKEYDFARRVTCAVLPFSCANKDDRGVAVSLRSVFTSSLYEGGIRLVKNSVLDTYYAEGGEQLSNKSVAEMVRLGKKFGADIVVQGELTKRTWLYAVVHSSITVAAHIQVVDVKKGVVIFDIQKEETRNAGLLRIPTGFVAAATTPLMGLDKYYQEKLVNDLARGLAEPINIAFNPDKAAQASPPAITDVSAIAEMSGSGLVVSAFVSGDEGCEGTFSIEDFIDYIPLTAIGKGSYTGTFTIPSGVDVRPRRITAFLANRTGGKSSRSIDITAYSKATSVPNAPSAETR